MQTMTRTLALLAAICCGAPAWAQDAAAPPEKAVATPTADALLARLVEAMGGAAPEGITTRVMQEKMILEAMGMELQTKTYQKHGNVVQIVEIPGLGTQKQGCKDGIAWASDPMQGPRLLEGADREMFLRSTRLFPYLHATKDYPTRTVVGSEKVGEQDCYKLELKPETGATEFWFIDKATHRLAGMSMVYDGSMGTMPLKFDMSDYRPVDGVQYPHKVSLDQGAMKIKIATKSIEHGVEIEDARFNFPPEIQKLVDKKKAGADKATPKPATPAEPQPKDPQPASQPAGSDG